MVGSGAIKQRGVNFYLDNRFYMMTSLDTERFNAFSYTTASVNTWYLFTGAYHPINGNSIYVNGILEAENQFTTRASIIIIIIIYFLSTRFTDNNIYNYVRGLTSIAVPPIFSVIVLLLKEG